MTVLFVAEPAARWSARPKLVVDASLVAVSAFGEAASAEADAQMRGRSLCAPAVIDYEVANVALTKVRARSVSSDDAARVLASYGELAIERFSVDILATVAARPNAPYCVGFAAESHDVERNADAKRRRKKVPLMIANRAQDAFGRDDNEVTLFDDAGAHPLPRMDKLALARRLVSEIAKRLPARS